MKALFSCKSNRGVDGISRTSTNQSNIYNGAFSENSSKPLTIFAKKIPS